LVVFGAEIIALESAGEAQGCGFEGTVAPGNEAKETVSVEGTAKEVTDPLESTS